MFIYGFKRKTNKSEHETQQNTYNVKEEEKKIESIRWNSISSQNS